MPSVMVIGAMKAGTTSFYHAMMSAVPIIQPGDQHLLAQNFAGSRHGTRGALRTREEWDMKEKSFWSLFYDGGIDSYLSYYPTCPVAMDSAVHVHRPTAAFTGVHAQLPQQLEVAADFSANVFDLPAAADRISQAYGDASRYLRFIILLDDPVKIFHSMVYMQLKHYRSDFDHAAQARGMMDLPPFLAAAKIQLANAYKCMNNLHTVDSETLQRCRGSELLDSTWNLQAAMAGPLLAYWQSVFKESHFIVISSQSYFSDPWQVTLTVARLLGLPVRHAAHEVEQAVRGQGKNNRNAQMQSLDEEQPSLLAELREFFKPHVQNLKRILASKHEHITVIGELKWIEEY